MAAGSGGNVAGSVADEKVVTANGVTILGYTDLPARLPTQASQLYGTNVVNMLTLMTPEKDGQLVIDLDDVVVRGMTVTSGGETLWPPPPVQVSAAATAASPAPTAGGASAPEPAAKAPMSPAARWGAIGAAALVFLLMSFFPFVFMWAKLISLWLGTLSWDWAGFLVVFLVLAYIAKRIIVAREGEVTIDGRSTRSVSAREMATTAAYRDARGWARQTRDYLEGNRDELGDLLTQHLPGVGWIPPQATFLAWLDVSALGIPAVNFGPGDPNLAHHDEERCPVEQIETAEAAVLRWLA